MNVDHRAAAASRDLDFPSLARRAERRPTRRLKRPITAAWLHVFCNANLLSVILTVLKQLSVSRSGSFISTDSGEGGALAVYCVNRDGSIIHVSMRERNTQNAANK